MKPEAAPRPVLASLLDRLQDDDPAASRDDPIALAQQLKLHRLSVMRDLSDLLNARRQLPTRSDQHAGVVPSVLDYGLSDLATVDLASVSGRERFRQEVENTIRNYEPRFHTVDVKVVDEKERGGGRSYRLVIEALLHAEPAPIEVLFDSVIDPSDGNFDVRERRA